MSARVIAELIQALKADSSTRELMSRCIRRGNRLPDALDVSRLGSMASAALELAISAARYAPSIRSPLG